VVLIPEPSAGEIANRFDLVTGRRVLEIQGAPKAKVGDMAKPI
jgi:hypothetical protein